MSEVERVSDQNQRLSSDELAAFRHWFSLLDAELCGQRFEADVKTGKLDKLANQALLFRPRCWRISQAVNHHLGWAIRGVA
jgi:hypothetical protein